MGNLFVLEGTTNPAMKRFVKHEMHLSYDEDKNGVFLNAESNCGRFVTEKIVDINDQSNLLVYTRNAVYEFKKIK